MKTLIVYESLHGSTEKCANILKDLLDSEIEIAKLQEDENVSLEGFDNVIVGGSIHLGVIHTRIENFLKKNSDKLLKKNLGLYLCCMETGDTARKQFETAYPENLRKKAVAKGLFGGEINLGKMSFFEKKLTKKMTGITKTVSKINEDEIKKFAEKMNKAK